MVPAPVAVRDGDTLHSRSGSLQYQHLKLHFGGGEEKKGVVKGGYPASYGWWMTVPPGLLALRLSLPRGQYLNPWMIGLAITLSTV